jgi:alanine dehydrogenase
MIVGVPKEIKDLENRVGLTPSGASALINRGHQVRIEATAGAGSGFPDADYTAVGADIVSEASAWDVDLVTKVKEPLESEYVYLNGQVVFTYFHLAGVTVSLTDALLRTKTTAVAYETVEGLDGRLPLLAPMSAVAGNMAVTMGAYYLARFNGGRGTLLGRVLGNDHGKVLVVGDGTVGRHAAASALGMGANVYIASLHPEREAILKDELSAALSFVLSNPEQLSREILDTDLLIGAVLARGAKAPNVITEEMVEAMHPGSVVVDVSIDQGGCIETARPTTHSSPVYVEHGVTHYCVTNMPGAYPRTSTIALTAATLPYTVRLADEGLEALRNDSGFAKGLNTYAGHITCAAVADALGRHESYREFAMF